MNFPDCPNYTKRRGCTKSRLRLLGETDDSWTFTCETCGLEAWVVTKPTANARAQLRRDEERLRVAAEQRRKHDARTRFFT